MKRRTFFGSCLALLVPTGLSAAKDSEESHYFDFSGGGPFTSNPRYARTLDYGKHQRAFCNGEDMGAVRRFVTGPHGWVERARLNKEGKMFIETVDGTEQLATEVLRGNVRYVDLRV